MDNSYYDDGYAAQIVAQSREELMTEFQHMDIDELENCSDIHVYKDWILKVIAQSKQLSENLPTDLVTELHSLREKDAQFGTLLVKLEELEKVNMDLEEKLYNKKGDQDESRSFLGMHDTSGLDNSLLDTSAQNIRHSHAVKPRRKSLQLEKLQIEKAELIARIEKFEDQVTQLHEKNDRLVREYSKLDQAQFDKQEKIMELQNEMRDLSRQHERSETENEKLQKKLASLEQDNQLMQQQIDESLEQTKDNAIAKTESQDKSKLELQKIQKKLKMMTSQYESYKKKSKQYKEKNKKLEDELADSKDAIKNFSRLQEQFNTKLAKASQRERNLRDQLTLRDQLDKSNISGSLSQLGMNSKSNDVSYIDEIDKRKEVIKAVMTPNSKHVTIVFPGKEGESKKTKIQIIHTKNDVDADDISNLTPMDDGISANENSFLGTGANGIINLRAQNQMVEEQDADFMDRNTAQNNDLQDNSYIATQDRPTAAMDRSLLALNDNNKSGLAFDQLNDSNMFNNNFNNDAHPMDTMQHPDVSYISNNQPMQNLQTDTVQMADVSGIMDNNTSHIMMDQNSEKSPNQSYIEQTEEVVDKNLDRRSTMFMDFSAIQQAIDNNTKETEQLAVIDQGHTSFQSGGTLDLSTNQEPHQIQAQRTEPPQSQQYFTEDFDDHGQPQIQEKQDETKLEPPIRNKFYLSMAETDIAPRQQVQTPGFKNNFNFDFEKDQDNHDSDGTAAFGNDGRDSVLSRDSGDSFQSFGKKTKGGAFGFMSQKKLLNKQSQLNTATDQQNYEINVQDVEEDTSTQIIQQDEMLSQNIAKFSSDERKHARKSTFGNTMMKEISQNSNSNFFLPENEHEVCLVNDQQDDPFSQLQRENAEDMMGSFVAKQPQPLKTTDGSPIKALRASNRVTSNFGELIDQNPQLHQDDGLQDYQEQEHFNENDIGDFELEQDYDFRQDLANQIMSQKTSSEISTQAGSSFNIKDMGTQTNKESRQDNDLEKHIHIHVNTDNSGNNPQREENANNNNSFTISNTSNNIGTQTRIPTTVQQTQTSRVFTSSTETQAVMRMRDAQSQTNAKFRQDSQTNGSFLFDNENKSQQSFIANGKMNIRCQTDITGPVIQKANAVARPESAATMSDEVQEFDYSNNTLQKMSLQSPKGSVTKTGIRKYQNASSQAYIPQEAEGGCCTGPGCKTQ